MATFTIAGATRTIGLDRPPIEIANRGETSFKSDLQQVYEALQADRVAMLTDVRELQLMAQLLMDSEASRLATLSLDDDRIALLSGAARTVLDRVTMLDIEVDFASSRVPMVAKTEAVVHGHLSDPAGRAVGALTVSLTDQQGVVVAGVPSTTSDGAGYYAIIVPAEVAAQFARGTLLTLFLSNDTGRVDAGVTPFSLATGSVKEQDIKLSDKMLDALKLRLTFTGTVISTTAATPRTKKAAATKATKGKGD
ncbi:MAG: hypothetical protein JWQ59_2475 [Cryobacterium sp.]|nr:hypothetical protein [Cryobacterium sp.]